MQLEAEHRAILVYSLSALQVDVQTALLHAFYVSHGHAQLAQQIQHCLRMSTFASPTPQACLQPVRSHNQWCLIRLLLVTPTKDPTTLLS